MQATCAVALKEWAVVCAALAEGRQTVLFRKGGIAEATGDFQVAERAFWLYPTRFHQSPSQFSPLAAGLAEHPVAQPCAAGWLSLPLYAEVQGTALINDESCLPELAASGVLSEETLRQRFHYREPGLHLLALQVYRRQPPHLLPEESRYAGCHSWVELSTSCPTTALVPVLSEEALKSLLERLPIAVRSSLVPCERR